MLPIASIIRLNRPRIILEGKTIYKINDINEICLSDAIGSYKF